MFESKTMCSTQAAICTNSASAFSDVCLTELQWCVLDLVAVMYISLGCSDMYLTLLSHDFSFTINHKLNSTYSICHKYLKIRLLNWVGPQWRTEHAFGFLVTLAKKKNKDIHLLAIANYATQSPGNTREIKRSSLKGLATSLSSLLIILCLVSKKGSQRPKKVQWRTLVNIDLIFCQQCGLYLNLQPCCILCTGWTLVHKALHVNDIV